MLALLHTSCVLLGKSRNLSISWFPVSKIKITINYPTLYTSYVFTVSSMEKDPLYMYSAWHSGVQIMYWGLQISPSYKYVYAYGNSQMLCQITIPRALPRTQALCKSYLPFDSLTNPCDTHYSL